MRGRVGRGDETLWFETLTGFTEHSPDQVRSNLIIDGRTMTSRVNGQQWVYGRLETPTLGKLRTSVRNADFPQGRLSLREVVADVQQLHLDPANAGALFQVASQFNLLEMMSPDVTPENGVGRYEHDHTQGPACAIAAGAGTIYRNYFVPVNGQPGQSAGNQIDCLADVGHALSNEGNRLWAMRNGYALASYDGLSEIAARLRAATEDERDGLRRLLRIGLHWDTEVTLNQTGHLVSQAYCSALPVAYSHQPAPLWADFARLILEAAYEATLCAAVINTARSGNNRLYLTMLGGGAFGNATAWILDSLRRALVRHRHADLDVAIVSYGRSNPDIQRLIDEFNAQ